MGMVLLLLLIFLVGSNVWVGTTQLLYNKVSADVEDNNNTAGATGVSLLRVCVAVHCHNKNNNIRWSENDIKSNHGISYHFLKFGYGCPSCAVDFHLDPNKDPFQRSIKMLRTITDKYSACSYVIKLDDDVEFYSDNLLPKNLRNVNFAGFLLKAMDGSTFASGGAGYVIRASLAKQMAEKCTFSHLYEDVGVSLCLKKHFGIKPTEIRGFYPDSPEMMLTWRLNPSHDHISRFHPDVEPITFHYVPNSRVSSGKIPKILHFIWVGDIRKAPASTIESCVKMNPDWDYIFWTDERIKQEKFGSKYQNTFYVLEKLAIDFKGWWLRFKTWWNPSQYRRYEHLWKADLLRLEILYLYGGVFLDADSTCQKPFNMLAQLDETDLFAVWENEHMPTKAGLVANGVIGSSQYNPDVFSLLAHMAPHKTPGEPWKYTGPCLVSYPLFGSRSEACKDIEDSIGYIGGKSERAVVLSSDLFYPIHHTGFCNGTNKTEFVRKAFTVQSWSSTNYEYHIESGKRVKSLNRLKQNSK